MAQTRNLTENVFLLVLALLVSACSASQQDVSPPVEPKYSREAVDHAIQLMGLNEIGAKLRKRESNVRMVMFGAYTPADQRVVEETMEIFANASSSIQFEISPLGPNVRIHFIPLEQLWTDSEKRTRRGRILGICPLRMDDPDFRLASQIYIDKNLPNALRASSIRHYLFHMLGFGHTSAPNSMGNRARRGAATFSSLDRIAIQIFLEEDLKAGMGKEDVLRVLGFAQ